jgi:hypothetical protein
MANVSQDAGLMVRYKAGMEEPIGMPMPGVTHFVLLLVPVA